MSTSTLSSIQKKEQQQLSVIDKILEIGEGVENMLDPQLYQTPDMHKEDSFILSGEQVTDEDVEEAQRLIGKIAELRKKMNACG